jgi:hypothetical protein
MGYQLVKVILKNGLILNNHKVLNSSLLILEKYEKLDEKEIVSIEAECHCRIWIYRIFLDCLKEI